MFLLIIHLLATEEQLKYQKNCEITLNLGIGYLELKIIINKLNFNI